MDISLNGYGENAATFKAQDGVTVGAPVKMAANGTVGACAAGDAFCGVALNLHGGYAAVQLGGYTQVHYTGTAPAVGYQTLAADASGTVKAVTTGGRSILVTDVDDTAKICGIIL